MAGINVNRTTISLPTELQTKIIQKLQEDSVVMALAEHMALPGLGATIPVITSDPEAAWVAETAEKPVSRPGLSTKVMSPYTLAVIVPFSNQFKDNMNNLYNEIVKRLPRAIAQKFDKTVFGGATAPGSNFDTFASVTAQSFGSDPYGAFVAGDSDISAHGGIANGIVLSPQAKGALLAKKDTTGRPLFANSTADSPFPTILGIDTKMSKAAYIDTTTDVIGFMGDWTQAIYGVNGSINISVSDQATLTDGDTTINLWQRNMFAVRAEIECGFVADTSVFNKLTV